MRITELYREVIDAINAKKFIGDFEVFICHPTRPDVKIKGYRKDDVAFPYDFSCELRRQINEICFDIVSGIITDGDFSFRVKGLIEYSYLYDKENK